MTRAGLYAAAAAAFVAAGPSTAAGAQHAPAPVEKKAPQAGGIQWFTRLQEGLAEARRTGRPILYLSAAPSCGGVPGVW